MSRKRRHRQKRSGHYCWACDSIVANERFSGKGHARHVCRDCSRLGGEEFARIQAIRNLERCLTDDGRVRRRCRRQFQQFLEHADPVVREKAEQFLADSTASYTAYERAEWGWFDGDDLIGVWIENTDLSCSDDDDLIGVWIEDDPMIEEWGVLHGRASELWPMGG